MHLHLRIVALGWALALLSACAPSVAPRLTEVVAVTPTILPISPTASLTSLPPSATPTLIPPTSTPAPTDTSAPPTVTPVWPTLAALVQPTLVRLAVGESYGCVITQNRGLHCWGDNAYGQLGNGTNEGSRDAEVNILDATPLALTAGYYHTCVVTAAGAVYCWGNNEVGQVGDGSQTNRNAPVLVQGLETGVVAVAAGASHTCALLNTGHVKCWGDNSHGQLGDGATTNRATPVEVVGLTDVLSLSAGNLHTCALTLANSVWCWGDQLSFGDTRATVTTPVALSLDGLQVQQLASGGLLCILTTQGEVRCWGGAVPHETGEARPMADPEIPTLAGKAVAITTGADYVCALLANGQAQCWGSNYMGSFGDMAQSEWVPAAAPVPMHNLPGGVVAFDANTDPACALLQDGSISCQGSIGPLFPFTDLRWK